MPCFKSTVFTSEVKSIHQHWTWDCLPLLPTFLACSCGNSAVNWWSIFCSQFLNATFFLDVVLLTGVPISTNVLFFPSCLFIHCYFCFTFVSLSQIAIKGAHKVKVCYQFLYTILHFILLPQATVFKYRWRWEPVLNRSNLNPYLKGLMRNPA